MKKVYQLSKRLFLSSFLACQLGTFLVHASEIEGVIEGTDSIIPEDLIIAPTLQWSDTLIVEAGSVVNYLKDVQVITEGVVTAYKIDVQTSQVQLKKAGTYSMEYVVRYGEDLSQVSIVPREVRVVDTTAPIIKLLGESTVSLNVGEPYQEPGTSVSDNSDDAIDFKVIGDQFSTKVSGTYQIDYIATDQSGNSTTASRTVIVKDTEAPKITLNGETYMVLKGGQSYKEPGYQVSDNVDRQVNVDVTGDDFNHLIEGTYTITYTAKDQAGNVSTVKRVIVVTDVPETLKPVEPELEKEEAPKPEDTQVSEEETNNSSPVIGMGQVYGSSVNVRGGRGTNFPSLGKFHPGEEIEVYDLESGWYKVNYHGNIGFIREDLLYVSEVMNSEVEPEPSTPNEDVEKNPTEEEESIPEEKEEETEEEIIEIPESEEQKGSNSRLIFFKVSLIALVVAAFGLVGALIYLHIKERQEGDAKPTSSEKDKTTSSNDQD